MYWATGQSDLKEHGLGTVGGQLSYSSLTKRSPSQWVNRLALYPEFL